LSFAAVARLPEADFLSWGWRLPFLASIVLVALGYYVRKKVAESPVFERLKETQQLVQRPVVEAISKNTRSFLVSAGLKVSENAWVYILTVFIVLYATSYLKLPRQMILDAFLYAAVVEFITIPIFGHLSDRIGRRPLYFFGSIFTIAFVFPLFWLIDMKSAAIITATVIVALSLGHGTMFGPQAAYFPELFGARVRYSGASTGFQFAAALAGGFSPIISTAILGYTGSTTGISLYIMGLALITLVATFFVHETVGKWMHDRDTLTTGAPLWTSGLTFRVACLLTCQCRAGPCELARRFRDPHRGESQCHSRCPNFPMPTMGSRPTCRARRSSSTMTSTILPTSTTAMIWPRAPNGK